MHKQVAITELSPGMMVTRVLEQSGPVKIRKVGMIRSPDMVKGLKEMGVSTVEVDFAQSISVDDDIDVVLGVGEDQPRDIENPRPAPTATQRLLASDRQIAEADRNLSQQFHRSLFIPSVEQMPSKWALYWKPYCVLSVVLIMGFCIGWTTIMGAKTIMYSLNDQLANNDLVNSDLQINSSETNDYKNSRTVANQPDQEIVANQSANTTPSNNIESRADMTLTSNQSELTNAQQEDTQSVNAVIDATDQTADRQALAPKNDSEQKTNIEQKTLTASGVVLEVGQRVLGYQGESLPESPIVSTSTGEQGVEQTGSVSSSQTNTSNAVNQDLLRKIQEAAEAVDSQTQSPQRDIVSVTDLNELTRIDQLSPALLTQMPAMSFSAHMYASNPLDRWVRVNSKRLGEGDFIAQDLMIKTIEPEIVILSFKGTDFRMNALSDW